MFQNILIAAAGFGSICWISILLLPWRPWSTRENLEANPENLNIDLSEVTVLTPARNEAEVIAQTMRGLNRQGKNLNIILIDDQSDDGTAEIARKASTQNLKIISGTELEEGWAGKLWALEQGRKHIKTPIILLLDADIDIAPGMIAALVQKMKSENLDLVSIMAKLEMHIFYEKLLIPSFIYFFKLLYPFALGNSPKSRLGVAAGGCILLRARALEKIGGFEALRGALIDDCTLAQKVKSAGLRTWIGLSHSVTSHRGYKDLAGIWNMVARSAFTQLKYSTTLLVLCTLTMISMFWLPLYGLTIAESTGMKVLCAAGWFAMVFSYLPTLYFYRRSPLFTFTMPIVGTLYLAMTWTSAIRYFSGRRSEWKGRIYKKAAAILVGMLFSTSSQAVTPNEDCGNKLGRVATTSQPQNGNGNGATLHGHTSGNGHQPRTTGNGSHGHTSGNGLPRVSEMQAEATDHEEATGAVVVSGRTTILNAGAEKSFRTNNQQTKLQISLVKQFAAQSFPVLILGETGTGKELIAKAIHVNSDRKDKPFKVINFGALSGDVNFAKSELFGHVKGAYTGAAKDRDGKLKEADGGTLFLDEIGNIHPELFGLLLRLLQENTYSRLGEDVEKRANVRIIAATNKNLELMIKNGTFPSDLFYRLDVLTLNLPPLRERPEDIEYLSLRILKNLGKDGGRIVDKISPAALAALRRYPWPGNVRELESRLKRAYTVLSTDNGTLDIASLPDVVKDPSRWPTIETQPATIRSVEQSGLPADLDLTFPNQNYSVALRKFLTVFLLKALDRNQWDFLNTVTALGGDGEGLIKLRDELGIRFGVHGLLSSHLAVDWKQIAEVNPDLVSPLLSIEEAYLKFRKTFIARSVVANEYDLEKTAYALGLSPEDFVFLTTMKGVRNFHDRSFLAQLRKAPRKEP